MSQEPTPITEDVDRIVRRLDRDFQLGRPDDAPLDVIVSIAEQSGSHNIAAVGMVVDGTIIMGAITSSEAFFQHLDESMIPGIEGTPFLEMRQEFEAAREAAHEVFESNDHLSIDELPIETAQTMFRSTASRGFVTLNDARVINGATRLSVGCVRVRLDSISAWWPAQLQEGTNVVVDRSAPDA